MAIPFLNNINLSDNQLLNAKAHVTSTAPTAAKGQIYLDSSDNILKYHNGTNWVSLVSSTGGTVTNVSSATTGQLTVANGSTTPTLSIVTAPVSSGSSALVTGGDIHSFVTNQGYLVSGNIIGTLNEVDVNLVGGNIQIGLPDNVTIAGNLTVIGTTITNHVETVSTTNGVVFEGTVVDANQLTLLAGVLTADRTITLPDESGTVALTSDIANGTLTVTGGTVLTGSGTFTANQSGNTSITINHASVSRTNTTNAQSPGFGGTFTVIDSVTTSTEGHVTAVNTKTVTMPSNSANTFATTITNSATVTHGLNTRDVIVQLFDTVTYETIYADVTRSTVNTVAISFVPSPSSSIRVLITKIG
jgi:hypothetical protein